jgi:putative acetyltransferase
MLIIGPETKTDYVKITKINDLAFGQKNEGRLVKKLRKNDSFIPDLSLVAEVDGKAAGHILFFPIRIIDDRSEYESLALAPMAVRPSHQRKGIGSELVRKGIEMCRLKGFMSIIVLGHPEFYPRFGFQPAGKWGITAPFDVPYEAFMALELVGGGLKDIRGMVSYPDEFLDV